MQRIIKINNSINFETISQTEDTSLPIQRANTPTIKLSKMIMLDRKVFEKLNEIYNRYAHVNFSVVKEESSVELIFADNVKK